MTATRTTTAQLAHELRETVGRLIRRLRAEPGPPVGQMAVLGRLDREGPASVSDLAAAERMRPQSMAQTVRDLESAGLVSRRPDPDDGRRVIVELTNDGTAALAEWRARREDWLAQTLDAELDHGERTLLEERLHLIPPFTMRLAEVPLNLDWPYWVPDDHFDLGYHVRELGLPAPGSMEQLAEQAGRIYSRRLDRSRPLWELYLIHGLA